MTWRVDYNRLRPSSLGCLTPAESAGLRRPTQESLAIISSDFP